MSHIGDFYRELKRRRVPQVVALYIISDNIRVMLNVNILTDNGAPLMADIVPGGNNTDSVLYDVFGRSYQLSLSARFFD